ncbi:MAG TPA: class I SAM-dependent methyltransferase [Anaerolineae bacterium]|nr:class I SAM-dependent methyltransferase [Anaerolineae bacterium]HIQ04449.1 class I SAM-dependent methyltransferase [Anaerolineae bacterium]
MEVELVTCPLCGAAEAHPLFTGPDRAYGLPGRFQVVRCQRCGLRYLNPRPTATALRRYYPPSGYYTHAPPHKSHPALARLRHRLAALVLRAHKGYPGQVADWVRWLTRPLVPLTGLVPPWREAGRLLDVGCGAGWYLNAMRAWGWRVIGLELDQTAVQLAQRASIPILVGDLAAAWPVRAGSFHVVTMWHVLEHLPDPVAALKRARQALTPGGLLLLEAPNADSLVAQVLGCYWFHHDLPRHLVAFNPATLRRALTEAGFRDVWIRQQPNVNGLAGGLQYWWDERTGQRGSGIYQDPLLRAVMWLPALLFAWLGRGDCLRAVAR